MDHYLGVRFIDEDSCLHYGWIRCDVKDEGRTLIIKDYSYETKYETGILAGDKIGDTSVGVVENMLEGVDVYSFNNDVYVLLNNLGVQYQIRIMNLAGEVVHLTEIAELHNVISLENFSKGYYLVEIVSENKIFANEVFIN